MFFFKCVMGYVYSVAGRRNVHFQINQLGSAGTVFVTYLKASDISSFADCS